LEYEQTLLGLGIPNAVWVHQRQAVEVVGLGLAIGDGQFY